MKNITSLLILLGLLLSGVSSQPTEVSYIVDVQEQDRQDFLQLTFSTHAEGDSLESAIQQAKTQAQNLRDQAQQICLNLIKDKNECKEAVEIGKVSIEPSYKEQKRQTLFEKITATYEVVITWRQVKVFGSFVDQLLTVEGIIIESIQWQPDEDLQESNFLEESLEKSTHLCSELGKKFVKVVSVEQLRDEPEEPEPEPPAQQGQQEEEQQPEEQQPEQQEQQADSYKITIICDGKLEEKKKKK